MFYVYHLIDPRTDSVFYVGKGQRGRIDAHEKEARGDSDHPKCTVIRSIWADGLQVKKIKARHFKDEQAAYDYEAAEVERIGLASLTNLIEGGGSPRAPQEPLAWHPIDTARKLLNIIALAIRVRQGGKRFNQPWEDVINRVLPNTIKGIVERYGIEFAQTELAKYGINAVFASKLDAV
jgi:hypothetical protein